MIDNIMGTSGFIWWQGVVEDNNDPLKLGRCRVRIFGWHNPNTQEIPTEQLPWAVCVMPVTSASTSEVGMSPTGLVCGSWVLGFFRDPDLCQQPVILGSIPGIPLQKGVAIGDGFADPSGTYPKTTHLGEADTSRLARNEKIEDTIVNTKRETVVSDVVAALDDETWNEPPTSYDAVYPNNHVHQTAAGHVQEFDDTPGAERIHTYHRSGTFEEVHPDGTVVRKIVAKNYEIILDDERVLIRGKKIQNIQDDTAVKLERNLKIEIQGDAFIYVAGNSISQTDGDHYHKVKGTYSVVSEGNMTFLAPRIDLNPSGRSPDDIGGIV
jgi:hypothetical protein